jgi:CDP-glucose 4,6-dehydratase
LLSEKKILVTGGSGLFGGWIVEKLLSENVNVTSFSHSHAENSKLDQIRDKSNLTIIEGDTRNKEIIDELIIKQQFNFIIHLAAQTQVVDAYENPINTFSSNITGTWNLLDSVRMYSPKSKVIISTSDKAYGIPESIPTKEDHKLHGIFPYEFSKSSEDLLAQTYATTYGLDIAILRCGNVFGGGDLNFSRLVPKIMRAFIHNETPTITRSGGDYSRDFIYVEDVANAFIQTLLHFKDSDELKIFNISNPPNISIMDIYKLMSEAVNDTYIEPKVLGRSGEKYEIPHQSLNIEKAIKYLDWKPLWDQKKALKKTYSWYLDYFNK